MTIDTFESVLLTCIFIAPGFIINRIINSFCPSAKKSDAIIFLICLIYSVLHLAIFSWAYILFWKIEGLSKQWVFLLFVGITIIGAALLGIIIGLIKAKGWIRYLAHKLKLDVINPIPTSWDYFFSQAQCGFVIVTLLDGSVILGYFGENSFASSEPEERDIYIEKVYKYGKGKKWVENEKSNGILISQSQIKTIEFLLGGILNNESEQQ